MIWEEEKLIIGTNGHEIVAIYGAFAILRSEGGRKRREGEGTGKRTTGASRYFNNCLLHDATARELMQEASKMFEVALCCKWIIVWGGRPRSKAKSAKSGP